MKTAALYIRVSTLDQTSAQQLQVLRDYCAKVGYKIVDEFIDEGESAMKSNRPEYLRLLDGARKRKFNTILVYKLDRFSRSLKELVNTMALLKEYGVDFVSYSEKEFDTTTSVGELMFNIVACFANFERSLISERTKLKLNHLKSQGVKLGRPQKLDLSRVFDLRAQKLSLSQIGRELGVDKSTVSKALKNGTLALAQR